jgi:hypothetical protein
MLKQRLVEFEFDEIDLVILVVSVVRDFAGFKTGFFRILGEFAGLEGSRRGEGRNSIEEGMVF